jgi:hypothetical protein
MARFEEVVFVDCGDSKLAGTTSKTTGFLVLALDLSRDSAGKWLARIFGNDSACWEPVNRGKSSAGGSSEIDSRLLAADDLTWRIFAFEGACIEGFDGRGTSAENLVG